ncbi:polyphosphate polymerase domain-containing protein [Herbiconiux moechotypicola]|uniref:VTC domain-containing protein n=1 Tax=Herbiconiux moechotypicola TaxID=637393 RepID=A0ABP5Q7U9_9MICO|nr:polyphosphate polymerase domain-containing protein [Herbiconiux moechotypicola]MCS5729204.1 polyphosphate polymerase domain-containing protein [Herbiconiux moechotypicola]
MTLLAPDAARATDLDRAELLVHAFDPISLDELIERASLQTRVDRKYVVPTRDLAAVLGELDDSTRVLEMEEVRDFRYESVYFDTPGLDSFWMAAHGRRRRFKMRTRAYVDSATAFFEVKTRGARSATVKDRLEYAFSDRESLTDAGLDYAADTLDAAGIALDLDGLSATLVTRYRRTTLFVPGLDESRATIDTHLEWATAGASLETPHVVVVETKSGSRPSRVDRVLWSHGHRPDTISKYGTGLAALDPRLRANKWARTLRRHFDAPLDPRVDTHPDPTLPLT